MRYQPVSTAADLDALRCSTEGRSLDFKERVDPKQWWELAKDIAAFANHVGGTILVGASEQANGAALLFGVTSADAIELAREYENAAKDKCKPRPLVGIEQIPLENCNVVVAVNVEPFPLALVGAMFYARDKNGKPQTCDAWRFAVRVGKHNVALQPDQIAMFMEPKTRRMVTLLERIPEAHRTQVTLHYIPGSGGLPHPLPIILEGVDVLQNVFVFSEARGGTGRRQRAPLDDVEAVWEGKRDQWQIKVSGYLDSGEKADRYVSWPSTRR
jgi:Putative DNA-binding domain